MDYFGFAKGTPTASKPRNDCKKHHCILLTCHCECNEAEARRLRAIRYLNINKKILDDLKIIVILCVERLIMPKAKRQKPNGKRQEAKGKGVNYDKLN